MKRRIIIIPLAILAAIQLAVLIYFAVLPVETECDVVAANAAAKTVGAEWDNLAAHQNTSGLEYTVIDMHGNVLYRTREDLSESVFSALQVGDAVLDVTHDGNIVGKIIIRTDRGQKIAEQKRTVITVIAVCIFVELVATVIYFIYIDRHVVQPFGKMKGLAERIAGGNLDIPLEMDRKNIFGAFTESFDIMRSELKRARLAETQAIESKKELVAKLSHDIKTPVASIRAVAEVGSATAKNKNSAHSFDMIIRKADQINALTTELFTATLEDMQRLSVEPAEMPSGEIDGIIKNSDYLDRIATEKIPEGIIVADRVRLQQVFDNIVYNSYKYADTDIAMEASTRGDMLNIALEDSGKGVDDEELPQLTNKFFRGRNAKNKDGAGLGLYISRYFMREMGGDLTVENGERGLRVTVALRLVGKN